MTGALKPLWYSRQFITPEDEAAVLEALRSDYLTQGPRVEAFEEALCEFTGARYAVAVNSGTAALHLALLAAGIGEGYTVATSPLSFVASANAALYCGARPIFIDVERDTGNMSARTLAEAQADPSWPGVKAIVPVHYAGRAVDVDALAKQAQGAVVIEDACHALGACYPGPGAVESSRSTVGCCRSSLAAVFSFHAVKACAMGEGGAVVTNDQGFADELRSLRSHGRDASGRMVRLGFNYRATDYACALGLSQLARVDAGRWRRDYLSSLYSRDLAGLGVVPYPVQDGTCAHHLLPIRIKGGKRDHVKAYLNERGIGAQVHYPAIHLQPYYAKFGWKRGDFPEAEAWADEELSLPLHAQMDEGDVARVVDTLKEALAQ